MDMIWKILTAVLAIIVIILAAVGMAACIQKWKITAIPIAVLYGVLGVTFAATYFGEWAD